MSDNNTAQNTTDYMVEVLLCKHCKLIGYCRYRREPNKCLCEKEVVDVQFNFNFEDVSCAL
jgi:hypothetical protein